MNKFNWYIKRIQLMSFEEILFYRIPQYFQKSLLGHLQMKKEFLPLELEDINLSVNYDVSTLKSLFNKNNFNDDYQFFDVSVNLSEIDCWRKDYKNLTVSPIGYYDKIEKQNFKTNGDVKYIAELSRFHFLPFLALKFAESNDEYFINQIKQILEDWSKQNPYLQSINWTSGIELAIRSVNLIYTHYILKCFKSLDHSLDYKIRQMMSMNYQFLKNHLSLYSSANNHLTAELMGLNVIATYFKVKKKDSLYFKTKLFEEIKKQVNKDGVHMELCTRYHSEVLDQFLISLKFLQANGGEIPEQIKKNVQAMFHFVEHVSYEDIDTVFGDNDDGSVLNPFFVQSFSLYESQLKSSNHYFKTEHISDGKIDFRNYLIFGDIPLKKHTRTLNDDFFQDSGYFFCYDHQSRMKLSFDCGKIGDDISAAHGHSDIFHFNIQKGSENFFVDSGTFQYHEKDKFWRDYFRGIKSHNTISLNGLDHATRNNRMSWINRPEKPVTAFDFDEENLNIKGIHNAFGNLSIFHERKIQINKSQKYISVVDNLKSDTNNNYKAFFYLHFHPDVDVIHKQDVIILKSNTEELIIQNKEFKAATIVKGDILGPLGWFSNAYGKKVSANTLVLILDFNKKLILETSIYYE